MGEQLLILPQQFQQRDCPMLHGPHLHRDHIPCIHQSADTVDSFRYKLPLEGTTIYKGNRMWSTDSKPFESLFKILFSTTDNPHKMRRGNNLRFTSMSTIKTWECINHKSWECIHCRRPWERKHGNRSRSHRPTQPPSTNVTTLYNISGLSYKTQNLRAEVLCTKRSLKTDIFREMQGS